MGRWREVTAGVGTSIAAMCATTTACVEAPPPLPSALIVVDVDVHVPRALDRLRVDVYGEDGTWLHTREAPAFRPEDWPVSFGLVVPEDRPMTALVRLRAFAEGTTRDYRGEAYEPRPTFTPPSLPSSLTELCRSLEELPPYQERTMRRGLRAITTDRCGRVTNVGAVGATIIVPVGDRYRFEVVRSVPERSIVEADTTLFLRRDCDSPFGEIACNDDIDADNFLSRLIVDLQPGRYSLLTGGGDLQEADLTLRWAPAASWGPETFPPAEQDRARASPMHAWPRLRSTTGEDVTPSKEPTPAATVDRLVRVRLASGIAGNVHVTLRGACAGAMARLDPKYETRVALESAETCTDDPERRVLPTELAGDGTSPEEPPARPGSFLDEPCQEEDSDDRMVCVPGGSFVLGGAETDGLSVASRSATLPMRLVGLHRFWIDRREVTVGRYRRAVSGGFVAPGTKGPIANDGPLAEDSLTTKATYSASPRGRESYPLNAVSWPHARALCLWYGGELPTEAQWEYAATAAGKRAKSSFVWGDEDPTCDHAVLTRPEVFPGHCAGGVHPESVTDAPKTADVTPLGIEAMGGNVAEYTRDSAARYDDPCWTSRGPIDPWCSDPSSPMRTVRGASFRQPLFLARATVRLSSPGAVRPTDIGFRCVYAQRPERSWSAP